MPSKGTGRYKLARASRPKAKKGMSTSPKRQGGRRITTTAVKKRVIKPKSRGRGKSVRGKRN